MLVNGTSHHMEGLDLRHNMEIVKDQNGTYSTHMFSDRAQTLVRQHATCNKDQVNIIIMIIIKNESCFQDMHFLNCFILLMYL